MNKILIITKSIMLTMAMIEIAYADNNIFHSSLLKSWTGYYVGIGAGSLFNIVQLKSQQLGFTNPSGECNNLSNFSALLPGLQMGYAYQFPNYVVLGVETSATLNTSQKETLTCKCSFNPTVSDSFIFKNQMQNLIKARAGRALNWNNHTFFPYFTAGTSFTSVELTYQNEGGDEYSKKTIQPGLVIGAGIEWAFKQHWSLRAEYYYADYGKTIDLRIPSIYGLIDPDGNAKVNLNSHNILLGVNYWI